MNNHACEREIFLIFPMWVMTELNGPQFIVVGVYDSLTDSVNIGGSRAKLLEVPRSCDGTQARAGVLL